MGLGCLFLLSALSAHLVAQAQETVSCSRACKTCTFNGYGVAGAVDCVSKPRLCASDLFYFSTGEGLQASTGNPGVNWGCLTNSNSVVFYYLQVATSGDITLSFLPTDSTGTVAGTSSYDVGVWGPFANASCTLKEAPTCGAGVGTLTLRVEAGKYYALALRDVVGNSYFKMATSGIGGGTLDCNGIGTTCDVCHDVAQGTYGLQGGECVYTTWIMPSTVWTGWVWLWPIIFGPIIICMAVAICSALKMRSPLREVDIEVEKLIVRQVIEVPKIEAQPPPDNIPSGWDDRFMHANLMESNEKILASFPFDPNLNPSLHLKTNPAFQEDDLEYMPNSDEKLHLPMPSMKNMEARFGHSDVQLQADHFRDVSHYRDPHGHGRDPHELVVMGFGNGNGNRNGNENAYSMNGNGFDAPFYRDGNGNGMGSSYYGNGIADGLVNGNGSTMNGNMGIGSPYYGHNSGYYGQIEEGHYSSTLF